MKPVPLAEAHNESVYGGKAVQLGVAIRAGLPVPPGIALPCAFVDAVASDDAAASAELEELCEELRRPLAARSSAVGEDSEAASFAGQHLTQLSVHSPADLLEAICAIRESAHSPAALAYRERLNLDREPRMGVVVQELVAADSAGVLFTQNPIDGTDELVVEASWGLGEAVVAGLVNPDRFRLSRKGRVLERTPGVKDTVICPRDDGGTEQIEVQPDRIHRLCLDNSQLQQLHRLAMRCEQTFRGAQDVEWAFAGETLFLLQRRALTTAPV